MHVGRWPERDGLYLYLGDAFGVEFGVITTVRGDTAESDRPAATLDRSAMDESNDADLWERIGEPGEGFRGRISHVDELAMAMKLMRDFPAETRGLAAWEVALVLRVRGDETDDPWYSEKRDLVRRDLDEVRQLKSATAKNIRTASD